VHVLKQTWQTTWARIIKSFKPRSNPSPSSPELERSITSVTREYQTLAAELQRLRTESEQAGLEEIRKIGNLEEAHQEASSARIVQAKQLDDLERRIVELEAERHQSSGLVKSIESSLTDVLARLDTLDNQARLFHAESREQEKVFEASLSLAMTRQNTTDTQLEALRNTSLQRVTALESSLADTSQQLRSLGSTLTDTSTRLERMNGQVSTLEQKLDLEHQLYLHTVKEIQSQVHSQDQRLNWTMMVAVFAMLLGSVAGGILIWDVQKNARILGGINMEVEQLGSAMARSRMIGPPAGADESTRLSNPGPAGRRDAPEDHRVVGETPLSDS
jgi:DNA repair exonuclease SbcCD ATPase subunit